MTEVTVCAATAGRDVEAGNLYTHQRGRTESATFVYGADYVTRPGAYALDPGLPLSTAPSQTAVGRTMFGAMTDCSPDRWGRTLLDRAEAHAAREGGRTARTLREVDYLLGVRDDLRQGALRFRHADGPFLATEETGVPALTDLPELLSLADAAERDDIRLPDLQRLLRAGSSLGGARPKAHVRDANNRIAIAKFPSGAHDTWNVMAWEKVTLDLARAAGIEVPDSTLLNLAGRHVLVIDRFDRLPDGQRVGYVSAMTMLEASDGDQRSYLEIAEVIEQHAARATDDLAQLWRRILFNVMVSNTDDHLRNHGFVKASGTSWALAPAFDLNPDPAPGPKHLSTAIDTADDTASIDLVMSVADYFRLSPADADRIRREVADTVGAWRVVAAQWLTPSEIEAMAPAFSQSGYH
ncbi:type II toxin-antitoxin system HipA family toxin [Cellulomonas timonensis]|uniref:type II toxin-antitoxin system HipA family toxin n=1 Tax=Cellulomonas timonensis TaxID=1689271 RepID=UPI00082A7243|nr:HipA domain-containing protein [Cellulomonas timonensis]